MLTDFFTKPLQGSLFRKMRAIIMGWKHMDTLTVGYESLLNKEHVEKK